MKKMILFAVSLFAANQVWAQQSSTASPTSSVETVNADNVPVEEYVPKVIIEGKWGTGPGEFGVAWTYASDVNSPQDESGEIPPIFPSSLAVDSKGYIYVLDTVNNRIQKFNTSGKYLKSIDVESYNGKEQPIWYGGVQSNEGGYVLDRVLGKTKQGSLIGTDKWFPFYWPLTALGINIVMDSKDNLYYYLKRVKNGEETGEVWEFRNDKLGRKTEVPLGGSINAGQGLVRDEMDDSIWLFNVKDKPSNMIQSHEVKENKSYTRQQRKDRYKNLKKQIKARIHKPRMHMEITKDGVTVIRE